MWPDNSYVIVDAIDDPDEFLIVDPRCVARAQPRVLIDRVSGGVGAVPVASHYVGAGHEQLARLVRLTGGAVGSDNPAMSCRSRSRCSSGDIVGM
jgi:hypothetical protein